MRAPPSWTDVSPESAARPITVSLASKLIPESSADLECGDESSGDVPAIKILSKSWLKITPKSRA